jgi:tetratricopeptide (TPR) repeat protein
MAVCFSMALPASRAGAQPAPDGPAEPAAPYKKAASERFREAEAAFLAGDFVRAGGLFEEANRLAPHPSALWNAARAWQRAGDPARAMNLYARYLDDAPADAPDRAAAAAAVSELRPRVARLEIEAREQLTDVHVDERPVSGAAVWVTPGTHLVRARRGGSDVSALVSVAAGAAQKVALQPRAATAPGHTGAASPPLGAEKAPASAATGPDRGGDPPRAGWPPVVFIIGASATAFSASWLVWSGVDTLAKRDAFNDAYGDPPRPPKDDEEKAKQDTELEEGRKAQQRTNFLIGSTAAAGAFTIVSAFLVDWRSAAERRRGRQQPRTSLAVAPGAVTVHGTF